MSFLLKLNPCYSEYANVIIDELWNTLPPIRSINHYIDLIQEANLPNMTAYRMTPKGNEEIRNQV